MCGHWRAPHLTYLTHLKSVLAALWVHLSISLYSWHSLLHVSPRTGPNFSDHTPTAPLTRPACSINGPPTASPSFGKRKSAPATERHPSAETCSYSIIGLATRKSSK